MNLTSNPLTNTNKDPEYFGNGEFEFVDNYSREYFVSAHKIVTRLDEEMYKDPVSSGHSGSSYGITMRNMEYIAKNGYNAFKNHFYS
jgi:hypothetical protein